MATLLIDCVPVCFEIELDDEDHVITVPALKFGSKIVTLDAKFSPMRDFGVDQFEFSYGFTVSELYDSEPAFFTQDRYEVERYFEGHSREHVLPTVCACLKKLIEDIQPGHIYRVTKGRNLPQKAYQKHLLVTQTLADLGYELIQTGTDEFSRTFWLMSR